MSRDASTGECAYCYADEPRIELRDYVYVPMSQPAGPWVTTLCESCAPQWFATLRLDPEKDAQRADPSYRGRGRAIFLVGLADLIAFEREQAGLYARSDAYREASQARQAREEMPP